MQSVKMISLRLFCSAAGLLLLLFPALQISIEAHVRHRRFLLFPRQAPTRHQFISGIGIPADLAYESLVIGHVLKAQFFLPYNVTVYRENPFLPSYKEHDYIHGRQERTIEKRSRLRWDIYEYIVQRLQSYGYKGQECLLQAICEANSVSFARFYSVFAELLHIFLSPSTTLDLETKEGLDFKEAERIGRAGDTCRIYDCDVSILNLLSSVLKVNAA